MKILVVQGGNIVKHNSKGKLTSIFEVVLKQIRH